MKMPEVKQMPRLGSPWHSGSRTMHMSRGRQGSRGEGSSELESRGRHGGRGEGSCGDASRGRHGGHRRGPFEGEHRGGRGKRSFENGPRERHSHRRGRDGSRVGRGDVRAAILLLLAEQPSHGYQIIQQVSERSAGIWQPSPGSVYPALQQLEDEGLVRAEQDEGRRVFHLTDAGRTYVEEHQSELTATFQATIESTDDGGKELRGLFHQVGNALRQVAHEGTVTQTAAARTLLINTRRQLYRILAEDESSDTERS
jgi:DNA-binding PadR family transcriptional regulator